MFMLYYGSILGTASVVVDNVGAALGPPKMDKASASVVHVQSLLYGAGGCAAATCTKC